MGEILSALKDTPVPTILIVAGIIFLLLAFGGQLAGKITLPSNRQKWAGVTGLLLLIAGVALYIAPPRSASTSTPSPIAAVPTSKPVETAPTAILPSAPPLQPTVLVKTPPATSPSASYSAIRLDPIANDDLGTYRGELPTGSVVFDGIPFQISRSFGTQGEALKDRPTSATLRIDPPVSHPTEVFILMNSGNTYNQFKNRQVGTIMLRFKNGGLSTTSLIAGQNIREWQFTATGVVGTLSSADAREVFRVKKEGKDFAVLDMLTIIIPDQQRESDLTDIVFTDTSQDTTGSLDPGFFVVGVTVQHE